MTTEAKEYEGPLRPLLITGHEKTLERVELRPDDQVMAFPYMIVPSIALAFGTVFVMTICSILVNAPLKELANPDQTPNPSKAPWYFMNLQELLLHMNPSLAGVIIPTNLVPLLLMAIPYIDRKVENVGHWFMTQKGKEITLFSAVYTLVVGIALALFDSYFTLDPELDKVPRSGGAFKAVLEYLVKNQGWPDWLVTSPIVNLPLLGDVPIIPYADWLTGLILPFGCILFFSVLLCVVVKVRWQGGIEEMMLALFTGFVFTYFLTTVIGAFFRGPSQLLGWPWAHPHGYNPIDDLL